MGSLNPLNPESQPDWQIHHISCRDYSQTATSIIIRCGTTLLIVRMRDGNCLYEAKSPIIVIMSSNTRVAV